MARKGSARTPRGLRSPCAERLEGRVLLAGNVTTTPTGTLNSPGGPAPFLEITGDNLDNEIMIKKGQGPDEIIVNGLNGTLVNGSTQEWHYSGVQGIAAFLNGGNDTVDVRNLDLAPGALTGLSVDGGAGDDRITVFNTTIDAEIVSELDLDTSAAITLVGELATTGMAPTTGNDFIEVANTTVFAEGGEIDAAVMLIAGEQVAGATVTGGNDHINVSNTTIRTSNATLDTQAAVLIFGDLNVSGDGTASTVGEGNDWIDVNGTKIISDDSLASASVVLDISGDVNGSEEFGPVVGSASVGQGNDTISVTNTEVTATATTVNNGAVVRIRGDVNRPSAFVPDPDDPPLPPDTATIGGGNDNISVSNTTLTASGCRFDGLTSFKIFGEDSVARGLDTADVGGGSDNIQVSTVVLTSSGSTFQNTVQFNIYGDGSIQNEEVNVGTIGVGNDTISVQNVQLSARGSFSDAALFQVFGDDAISGSTEFLPTVGHGDDDVNISNLLVEGDPLNLPSGAATVRVDVSTGDDEVDVLNSEFGLSRFDMGDGNDDLTFNGNSFVSAILEGFTGIDRLNAHGNVGALLFNGFEIVNMS